MNEAERAWMLRERGFRNYMDETHAQAQRRYKAYGMRRNDLTRTLLRVVELIEARGK